MVSETADNSVEAGEPAAGAGVVIVFSGTSALTRVYCVGKEPLRIGRRDSIGSLLPDDRLSRQHAEIVRSPGGWIVRDLGSRNGTFVDGERVRGEVEVRSPRVIRLADTLFVPVDDVGRVGDPERSQGLVIGSRLRDALADVQRAANAGDTLLIQGETGTGKEFAARRFHEGGPFASGPFVAVNCAAIPAGLAERLLFGAKRGAYSGATTDATGHLRAADGGVLFLDEAGELELAVQAKLLRALESREVVPLGASRGSRIMLGICLATHKELRAEVAAGRFRRDLYHRIAPPEVVLPALRARRDEIALHVAEEVERVSPRLKAQARLVEACLVRHWPGNVRELRKHVRFAALKAAEASRDRVRLEDLEAGAGELGAKSGSEPASLRGSAAQRPYVHWSQGLTREDIERALRANGGTVSLAARSLGMQRSQLYREMARVGIKPADVRE